MSLHRTFRPAACGIRLAIVLAAGLGVGSTAIAQSPSDSPAPKSFKDAQATAQAAEKPFKLPALVPGERAPALKIAKWVKGEPISSFQPGKVYVVEFWAVWCGPCIQNMPHLTKLQQQYRDSVTFIGVTAEDERNTLEAVEKFVAVRGPGSTEPGGHMDYTVAFDDARTTYAAYMQAAARQGIPCAYIVDQQGKIAWIGHPAIIDEPLKQIVTGSYDLSKEAESYKQSMELDYRGRVHTSAFRMAMRESRFDDALASCEKLLEIDAVHFRTYAFNKFMVLLASKDQPEVAYSWGREAIGGVLKDDADQLGRMAWAIMDSPQVKQRDHTVALAAANRAVEVTNRKDALALATLSKVQFVLGDKQAALSLIEEAEKATDDDRTKALIKEQRDEMANGKPEAGGG